MGEQTRLKITIGLILLVFIQSILKNFLPGLPFTEAAGFEVAIGGWYLQKKSQENEVKIVKANNGGSSMSFSAPMSNTNTESLPSK